ncbi:helix-turn-helix transcriptional regulator [Pseudomonas purpurea]|uniref:helix-turn-helix transcriptional regulator n=1 Tax=Pseudomonas purpurea TaxID=3136737 RepID=UPI003266A6C9
MKKKKTCGPRFRALLKEVGIKPSEFATFCNVDPQHVNNWYHRGVPDYRMEEIAGLLSVTSKWLSTGEGPKHTSPLYSLDHPGQLFEAAEVKGVYTVNLHSADVELPLYKETPISPGASQNHVIEVPGQSIRLPRRHMESLEIDPDQAICVPMIGNSMAEKIDDGSIIALDRGLTQVVDGEIYALEHDGMLRVKYLHRMPGNALRLRSHNSAEYPDELFSAEQIQHQNIHIMGWVFWWSTLNKRRPPVPFT